MKRLLPVQLGVCFVLACALAAFAILSQEIFANPAASFCGLAAVIVLMLFCAVNAIPDSVYSRYLGIGTEPNLTPEPTPPAKQPKRMSVPPPSCEDLLSLEVQTLLMDLDSDNDWIASRALQTLNDRFGRPIMAVQCWPNAVSSRLKEVAAEVLLREWLEIVTEFPGADDDEIIDIMFPAIEEKRQRRSRRFRKLREMAVVTPPPLLIRKLDEWSETVKNAVIDINIGEPPGESFPEGEDKALLPFDRERYISALSDRMHESLDFIADAVGEANTDYELLCNHKKIEPFLTNMSWEAIAIALEQRQAEPEPAKADEIRQRVNEMPTRWSSSQPLLARPTESWVRKYRRMKAQGL
jgi:hypothetical protein